MALVEVELLVDVIAEEADVAGTAPVDLLDPVAEPLLDPFPDLLPEGVPLEVTPEPVPDLPVLGLLLLAPPLFEVLLREPPGLPLALGLPFEPVDGALLVVGP